MKLKGPKRCPKCGQWDRFQICANCKTDKGGARRWWR